MGEASEPKIPNTTNKISTEALNAENQGYSKALTKRQLEMIAIGGAIGTGLFLGAGGRLASAGPILLLLYAVAGFFAFMVVRALAELVLHRPSSGSFVSYAREFIGEKGAFVVGWMYFVVWVTTGIADVTAIAIYAHYWGAFKGMPQWSIALIALLLVLVVNLISVKYFGVAEYWAAMIKVGALVIFLGIGVYILGTNTQVSGYDPGLAIITQNGGLLPMGVMAAIIVIPGVVFAYASLEMFSIAAGETKDAATVIPKAANAILWRIGLFYLGSVLLLVLMLPYFMYSANESPFVTVLSGIGIQGAAGVMNFVVLTAALSSFNSGLYATARILRSMSFAGSAPKFTSVMSRRHVPYGGILLIASFYFIGIWLNYVVPAKAFDIVLNLAALGILTTWSFIMYCSLVFWYRARKGLYVRPVFKLPWAPYSNIITILFFLFVYVSMWFDGEIGKWTVLAVIPLAIALTIGWFFVRSRVAEVSSEYKS